MLNVRIAGVLGAAGLIAGSAAGAPPSFTGLGVPAGADSTTATGISGDGVFVVGSITSTEAGIIGRPEYDAFRWSARGGMEVVRGSAGAGGASFDGSVVAGTSESGGDGGFRGGGNRSTSAFRWEGQGGGSTLGGLSKDRSALGLGAGVSGDGVTVVGASSVDGVLQAVRWRSNNRDRIEPLGALPEGSGSVAYGASYDGSVIVGSANSTSGDAAAFRWTESGGMEAIAQAAWARAVSADGRVIVGGTWISANEGEAFRWSASGGFVRLGDLTGGSVGAEARDVSGDGSLIVGRGVTENWQEAFIWDEANGMRRLHDVLEGELGLDLTGWVLRTADAISDDGRTIAGSGSHSGAFEAWVAHLGGSPMRNSTMDVTGDGVIDVFDLLAYLDLWFGAAAGAERTGDGVVDVFDLLAYLEGWFAG